MPKKEYLTREEFADFRDNHFHTLELRVAEILGGQRVQLAVGVAIMGMVAAILVLVLL